MTHCDGPKETKGRDDEGLGGHVSALGEPWRFSNVKWTKNHEQPQMDSREWTYNFFNSLHQNSTTTTLWQPWHPAWHPMKKATVYKLTKSGMKKWKTVLWSDVVTFTVTENCGSGNGKIVAILWSPPKVHRGNSKSTLILSWCGGHWSWKICSFPKNVTEQEQVFGIHCLN